MHTLPHLTTERLAALADESPTPLERSHLESCPDCRRERDAEAALVSLAVGERARIGPPVSSWDAVAAGLRAEGLMRAEPPVVAPLSLVKPMAAGVGTVAESIPSRQERATHVTFRVPRWAVQAAAALLLVAGGVVAGRLSADGGRPAGPVADGSATGTAAGATRLVSRTPGVAFASREQALGALDAAEREYQRAAEFLAKSDSVAAPAPEASAAEVYRARLAAFDGVVAATQQALYAAPADPVINRYYLATNAAREVALKQLSLVAPAGGQINRY